MKNILISLCLCLTFFLPSTPRADVTGEIVIAHPVKPRELWITRLNTGGDTYQIYAHKPEPNFRILDVVTQKDGDYIAFLARSGDEAAGIFLYNIYLMDKTRRGEQAHNLTQNRYGEIWNQDFDISKNGDIVFACISPPEEVKKGIYLIPQTEFQQAEPQATLLVEDAREPIWFPDGEKIAYVKKNRISIFTVATGKIITLEGWGFRPTISPDGRYLALVHSIFGGVFEIEIYSLFPQKMRGSKKLTKRDIWVDFKWSPDGKHVVYTASKGRKHYAISFDERTHQLGRPVEFLEKDILGYHVTLFDWTHSGAYPVEPADRLTTLWGKLKQ